VLFVDLRDPERFAAGHPAGAFSVAFSARGLAERIASVAPESPPVVLIAVDPAQAASAVGQLAAAGRGIAGVLLDDPAAWRAANPVAELADLSVAALGEAPDSERVVLDVREPLEWESGHVPGALLIPLGRLRDWLDRLPREREIAVICEAGIRSATAASLLLSAGFPHVANVGAGTAGYRRGGWPLAFPE
jgi:hydroxyacylglutathione hydrolase